MLQRDLSHTSQATNTIHFLPRQHVRPLDLSTYKTLVSSFVCHFNHFPKLKNRTIICHTYTKHKRRGNQNQNRGDRAPTATRAPMPPGGLGVPGARHALGHRSGRCSLTQLRWRSAGWKGGLVGRTPLCHRKSGRPVPVARAAAVHVRLFHLHRHNCCAVEWSCVFMVCVMLSGQSY